MTIARQWAMPFALALGVTAGLLLLMQALVWRDGPDTGETRRRGALDIVRTVRAPTVVEPPVRRLRRPVPPATATAPGRSLAVPRATAPALPLGAVGLPSGHGALSIAGAPTALGPPSAGSAELVPIVRTPPRYPRRAQQRGIEGWVRLRFTVTTDGTTADVEVVGAEPRGHFEAAAVRAVERYRFAPRTEAGVPVETPGQEIVIQFELED